MTARPAATWHLLLVTFGFAAIAVVCTWPVAREATRSIPGDAGDPLLNAWALGWVADRLGHGLSGVWTAPNFFPYRNTLAFSEHLFGIAPFVAPIVWATGNPLLAYNVAFVASFALAGIGTYALVSDLTGGRRLVAWTAALAFAIAPSRLAQIGHLQVLMSGWMPLALWALHRYLRTQRWTWLAAFTGFALVENLSNSYYVYFAAVPIALVALDGICRARAGRARLVIGMASAASVVVLSMLPIASVYLGVRDEYGFRRTEDDVIHFGADLGAYLQGYHGALQKLPVWRIMPLGVKPAGPEGHLFPGSVVLVLGAVGAIVAWAGRRAEFQVGRVYSLVLVAALWLSMGLWPTAWGIRLPIGGVYASLFRHFPGFDGIRVPARLSVVVLLAADVLAAIGLAWIYTRVSRPVATVITASALIVVALEGFAAPLPMAFVGARGRPEPTAYNWVRDHEAGAVLELPAGVSGGPTDPFRYQYQTLFHRHRVVNGSSGYDSALDGFVAGPASPFLNPDEFSDALRMVRAVGIRTVLVHPADFTDRDVEALTVRRLREARAQVIRETALPKAIAFTLASFSVAERGGVPGTREAAGRVGTTDREIPVRALTAESPIAPERLPFLFDNDPDSRWLTGGGQAGGEFLDIVLDRPRDIVRMRLETSVRSIGNYPRHLLVEAFDRSGDTRVLFDGSVLLALGEGLVTDPLREPIDLWLPANLTTRLRLRQTGRTRTWFWAIDELKLFETP